MAGDGERASFTHGQDVLKTLNRDLANEMNSMLMYMADSLLMRGTDSLDVRQVAEKFSLQEFGHARKLAARIVELDGVPQLMPIQIQDNASITMKPLPKHQETEATLKDALEHELMAVIEYRNQVQQIGFTDPATRLLLEEILADKEHQAEEIRKLLGV